MANVEHHDHDGHADHSHGPQFYVKIWAILLVLFVISVAGPEVSHNRVIILITAFGIALVKAYMVATNFMHIKAERKFVPYMMFAMLGAVFLFYIAVSTDVEKTSGNRWENAAAKAIIEENKDYQEVIEAHEARE